MRKYFELETARLESRSLAEIETPVDWKAQRSERVLQMQKMLGMPPMENRPPLKAKVTGTIKSDDFIVENFTFSHYQVYVTGNLYLPSVRARNCLGFYTFVDMEGLRKTVSATATRHTTSTTVLGLHVTAMSAFPSILSSLVKSRISSRYSLGENALVDVSWLHTCWCRGMEWNSCNRLLLTRSEVDGSRIGVTGRSGGGAYSWWITALDERVKVSVPVAGITSLRNHIIDGCIEGHCDCMFWSTPVNGTLRKLPHW